MQIIILSTLPKVWRSPDISEFVSGHLFVLDRKVDNGLGHVAADDAAPPVLVPDICVPGPGVERGPGEARGHQARARGRDHVVRADTGDSTVITNINHVLLPRGPMHVLPLG